MRIIIGGDFVPTRNKNYFKNADEKYLLGEELSSRLVDADYRVFNLETPLADVESPIVKYGPNLIAPSNSVALFRKLHIDLFTIGNNHIMDQGEQGLASTIKTLSENNINFVGAGRNLTEASLPFVADIEGKKIGFFACSEHEFSIASDTVGGANPFDPIESFDQVNLMKQECDYIIVLYHGGKEHYRYPSPKLQKYCRKFIDKGADLVVCQHSHCIGCEEKYLNGTIVYGQGNFLFDNNDRVEWKTGLLVEFDKGKISYIPILKKDDAVRIAPSDIGSKILQDFYQRSLEISEPSFVEKRFYEFSENLNYEYLWNLSGASQSLLLRSINKLSGYTFYKKYIDKKYNNQSLLGILNCLECEAHNEVAIQAIKCYLKYKNDIDL